MYLLGLQDCNFTYLGSTNNFSHRLRQHNGEICGGARTTANRSKHHKYKWKPVCIVRGFRTRGDAYSFEKLAKEITYSKGVGTPADNVPRTTHRRIRQLIIVANLARWSSTPLVFDWQDTDWKPKLTDKTGYLPDHMTETETSSVLPVVQGHHLPKCED